MSAVRVLFGFRDDIDLNERWWHRLAKVAFILSVGLWALWFAFNLPAELPSGSGNIRIVETLADYVVAHPDDGDPVETFAKTYGYRSGTREVDGGVGYAFFETSLYCAVRAYDHLGELVGYLQPSGRDRPTEADALRLLESLGVERGVPAKGYTCIQIYGEPPAPESIVGWEYTGRAQVVGNLQKYGALLAVVGVFSLIVLNLYYRVLLYIICGPRRRKQQPQGM